MYKYNESKADNAEGGIHNISDALANIIRRETKSIENKARDEGRNEGRILTLIDLVQDGSLDIEIAAAKAKMTVDEFKKTMNQIPLQAV